jgi:four helix bundle protein
MNTLQQRLVTFSVMIFEQIQGIKRDPLLGDIANQLLRSATSAGANYSEAQAASSSKDFHNKIRIALKEMKETQYWISFLQASKVEITDVKSLFQESDELIRILSTICKKTDPANKPNP